MSTPEFVGMAGCISGRARVYAHVRLATIRKLERSVR